MSNTFALSLLLFLLSPTPTTYSQLLKSITFYLSLLKHTYTILNLFNITVLIYVCWRHTGRGPFPPSCLTLTIQNLAPEKAGQKSAPP